MCARFFYRIIAFFCFWVIHLFGIAQVPKGQFKYGVCGHPLTQEAYQKNVNLQLKLVKENRCSYYRIDLPIDTNGTVVRAKELQILLQKAEKVNIKIVPVLVFDNTIYRIKSTEAAYKSGIKYGRNFAQVYKNSFTYYEVGNEEDNNVILSQRAGILVTDYDSVKAKIATAYFRGICESIKQVDKSAKLIINHGWIHRGFLDILQQHNVRYDIIGLHWYSDMSDLQNAGGSFGDAISALYKRFGKRIWLTEMNIRNGTSEALSNKDSNWLTRNLTFIRLSKFVDAVFIYELLDEPTFANKESPGYNPNEAKYGLCAWKGNYLQVSHKPVSTVYKMFIQHNP